MHLGVVLLKSTVCVCSLYYVMSSPLCLIPALMFKILICSNRFNFEKRLFPSFVGLFDVNDGEMIGLLCVQ